MCLLCMVSWVLCSAHRFLVACGVGLDFGHGSLCGLGHGGLVIVPALPVSVASLCLSP